MSETDQRIEDEPAGPIDDERLGKATGPVDIDDERLGGPHIVITPGVDEDPEEVSGDPVDEADVLGDAAYLADPAYHTEDPAEQAEQGGDQ